MISYFIFSESFVSNLSHFGPVRLHNIFCLVIVLSSILMLFYLTGIESFHDLKFFKYFFFNGKGQKLGFHSGVKIKFTVGTSDGTAIPVPNSS